MSLDAAGDRSPTPPAPGIRRLAPIRPCPVDLDDEALVDSYANPALPHLRVNFVTSADGAVTVAGRSTGLSSPADKRVFAILRMLCDALLVGAGTLRQERYRPLRLDPRRRSWRRRHGLPEQPTLVVVSGSLDLDPTHPALADSPVRPIVLTTRTASADRRRRLAPVADVIAEGDPSVDLTAGLDLLRARGHRHLLCEGGPMLFGALTAADLVDELCLSVSPLLAGAGAGRITAGPLSPVRQLDLRQVLVADDGLLLLRYLRRPDPTPPHPDHPQ
ncbi:pyrimidine reductase family protein [Solwaraspora sp. WMMD406]|uniref:pyrimidine reductase family protein n=1 Tax=Solwaraspora sp. WMMD406 TaxID=3016095 RepID=UPI002417D973|nr:pyrimidine reductase family protein [Solwaraspora sp. WMMD406]MDG4766966.1 pyrimidine reductase family protein [Solwaraspora sp. WMMD406]